MNAGFENYRDYKFQELGRFDYTVADCEAFHVSIREYILPLVDELYRHKAKSLSLDSLRPYDLDAEPEGQKPLEPFRNADELLEKSIAAFSALRPFLGDCFRKMESMGHFDLDSRNGKALEAITVPLPKVEPPLFS